MTKSVSGACEHCSTRFDCKTMASMIAAAENRGKQPLNGEFLAVYDRVMERLKAAGWSYPQGTSICHLAGDSRELQDMIAELVESWRTLAKSVKVVTRTSYDDEVSSD